MPIIQKARYTVIVSPEYQKTLVTLAKNYGVSQGMMIECLIDMAGRFDAEALCKLQALVAYRKSAKVDGRKTNAELAKKLSKLSPAQIQAILAEIDTKIEGVKTVKGEL